MFVNFGDEILLKGVECKTQVNLNFFTSEVIKIDSLRVFEMNDYDVIVK